MSAPPELKGKDEKDAELDRRIEALRRKNQALLRRYQEIEEDRKKAEQEGVAVTGGRRAPPADGPPLPERRPGVAAAPILTVQVLLSPEEKRVVSKERKPTGPYRASRSSPHARGSARVGPGPGSTAPRAEGHLEQPGWEAADRDGLGAGKRGRGPRGRGPPPGDSGPDRRSKEWEERRRQNIEKMNEEMEKIAEYEQSQRDGLQERNPVRNFLDDPRRSGPSFAESDRREGSRRHIRNWGGADFDKVKTGVEQGKAWSPVGRGGVRRKEGTLDMTLSMTGRERAEYIRWKQEREEIDRERLARHRQATGEWRREWDAEKLDTMYKEGARPGGSAGSKQDQSKRPPKRSTFGELLSEHRPERRRKGRGHGQARGTPSKPYSMHDNRWEKEEQDLASGDVKADTTTVQQQEDLPAVPLMAPDDEDQWEDVSEGEEEGEEGSGSQEAASAAEEEAAHCCSPRGPLAQQSGRDGPLWLTMPPPELNTSSVEGKPSTPFSPAEGYCPVSDWGEEMELSSPRTDSTKSPTAVPLPGALAVAAEEGLPVPETQGAAAPEPAEQGTPAEAGQYLLPGSTGETPDSQQEKVEA